jgi:cytochrome P450
MSTPTPNVQRIVQPIPGLRFSLPFYAFRRWVKFGDPIRLFEHLHKTYGNIAQYRFMGTPIIFINHPGYIQNVLVHDAHRYAKERTVRRMKILLGEGLITSEDPTHIRQVRIVAPAFRRQRIAAYAGQIVDIAAAHSNQWQPGQHIDIAAASMSLSLEIIARTLFNTNVTPDIRAINDEVNTIMGLYNFIVALPRVERYLHLPIPKLSKFRRSKANLDAVVYRLISERRAEIKAHREGAAPSEPGQQEKTADLLTMLLASTYEPVDKNGYPLPPTGEPLEHMSDRQVRDEVLTIFLAGYETVANALTWTWYLLSQNPEAEAKLLAELDAVLGIPEEPSSQPEKSPGAPPFAPFAKSGMEEAGSGSPEPANEPYRRRLPTLADIPNLKYTEQVFAESIRLYPPAWAMGRMCTTGACLGPYNIPKGAHIFFSQYILSRTPEYFPDPLRFDPDRFTPEAKAARDKYTYIPFGGGPRQCIGESFAWMEGILTIATIASRWRMTYLGSKPPIPQPRITLRPRDPLHMKLHPR